MESTKHQEEVVTTVPTTEAVVEESKKGGAEKKDGKAERDAKKQARLAERQAKTTKDAEYKKDPKDTCAHKFGDLELNRSQSDPELRYAKKFTEIHDIDETLVGQDIIVRGRLHGSRSAGKKLVFIVIRDRFSTVQATLFVAEPEISQGMAEYTRRITKESIIEVYAKVVVPENPVQGCSQKVELHITQIWTINKSAPMLPFSIDEAGRRCENQEDEERTEAVVKNEESKEGSIKVTALVGQDVRLNNRIIDLRVPCNQALMRL
jgi:aspartyl-tRNA synthetase